MSRAVEVLPSTACPMPQHGFEATFFARVLFHIDASANPADIEHLQVICQKHRLQLIPMWWISLHDKNKASNESNESLDPFGSVGLNGVLKMLI